MGNRIRICVITVLLAAGCQGKLETGYKPRLIGDSEIQRRGYYAGEFTTQKKAAEMEDQSDSEIRRPGPRY
jgi:hypothetical protein